MFKRFIILATLITFSVGARAQYLQYTPNPYVPEPDPAPLPQPQYVPPPPTYYPQPNNNTTTRSSEKLVALYVVTTALVDNMDMTSVYVGEDAKIAIYTKDGTLNMSIIRLKTNSETFGAISDVLVTDKPATADKVSATERDYTWTFRNSFNSDNGTAYVQLTEVNQPAGIIFVCRVKFPDGESDFKGVRQK